MAAIVKTALGEIEGTAFDGYERYAGIRYAQAPVGALRFRPPVPVEPWEGVYEAKAFGSSSIQPPAMVAALGPGRDVAVDEDCLFLNVYTPKADDGVRPVMVWIHGGAYTMGSGNVYDGASFARNGDVVVVTLNYRLGVLGFAPLDHLDPDLAGSGNNGIRDQIAALEWVRDHIKTFGGDPGNVTIFGESAGGGSISAILASPAADGLYRRAIIQSGAAGFGPAVGQEILSSQLLAAIGQPEGGIDALRAASTAEILEAQGALASFERLGADETSSMDGSGMGFHPVVDGVVVTRTPAEAMADKAAEGVSLLIGTNLDEGTLFTMLLPKDLTDEQLAAGIRRAVKDPAAVIAATKAQGTGHAPIVDLMTEGIFRIPSLRVADALAAAGGTAYVYQFTWATPAFGGALGATHALEIPFVFNMTDDAMWSFLAGPTPPRALAEAMHGAWTAFARTGDPNTAAIPTWPAYDAATRPTMVFGDTIAVVEDPASEIRKAWYGE